MSNYLAIATVTATLKSVLADALAADRFGVNVSTTRPDTIGSDPLTAGVNIYLYQVTPDPHLRNDDLPTRRPNGQTLIGRPQAALDLHYLLTFYGDESQLMPQRILGSVIRTLHSRPILSAADVQKAVAEQPFLQGSDLATAVERVRITPAALSLEELSKLWSVFFQTRYVLSVVYQASVILITADERPVEPATPVKEPVVTVVPTAAPSFDPLARRS